MAFLCYLAATVIFAVLAALTDGKTRLGWIGFAILAFAFIVDTLLAFRLPLTRRAHNGRG